MSSQFGQRLKSIREDKNWSQEQMANLLGTSKQVISRYETGQRTPKITVVDEYAKKLGIPLEQLTGYEKQNADERINEFTDRELKLLSNLHSLDPEQREFFYRAIAAEAARLESQQKP